MGSRDFYTDAEVRAMEAADVWAPLLEAKQIECDKLKEQVKRLKKRLRELRK